MTITTPFVLAITASLLLVATSGVTIANAQPIDTGVTAISIDDLIDIGDDESLFVPDRPSTETDITVNLGGIACGPGEIGENISEIQRFFRDGVLITVEVIVFDCKPLPGPIDVDEILQP